MLRVDTTVFSGGRWSSPLPTHLDSERTLVLAFGASHYFDAPAALADVSAAFPRSTTLGCSTAGEIHGTKILDGSVVVTVVRFERTRLTRATRSIAEPADAFSTGRDIARDLDASDLAGVLVLSDGVGVNGSELTRGFREVLGARVAIVGGLAADGDRFARTWVLDRGMPRTAIVSAVGLYGDALTLTHGSQGGWDIFGPERLVTRASANVLYELDGKPALDLYRKYLGELAAGLPATALLFPLAVRTTRKGLPIVRTVLSVNEADHSMTFAGDIPQGSLAQLMRANFERLIEGASQAADQAAHPPRIPTVCLAISCVGRRLVLKQRAEEELEAVSERLAPGTPLMGFYSYGEISPHADGACELHNQTMTLTTIGER